MTSTTNVLVKPNLTKMCQQWNEYREGLTDCEGYITVEVTCNTSKDMSQNLKKGKLENLNIRLPF